MLICVNEKSAIRLHLIFLLLWKIELLVIPVLALLDFGFSVGLESNFFARFGYIASFLLASYYLYTKKKGLPAIPLILVFFIILVVGALKGLMEMNLNAAFLSHLYYLIMPIVMVSYGWHFFSDYNRSEFLRFKFSRVMFFSFYVGVFVVILFQLAHVLGLANYGAIGIWNFLFSAPFLLHGSSGFNYFGVSLLLTILAGKRGILVVFFAYAMVILYLSKGKTKAKIFLALIFISFSFLILLQNTENVGLVRTEQAISALEEGDIDGASAMRWAESASALNYIDERFDHLLLGAGFGARYKPYPYLPGYEDFYRHYTHFGIISYIWIGGLFAPIVIYAILIFNAVSLVRLIKCGLLDKRFHFFAFWIWGIITVSLFGAVLMNNSFLWFIVGCCLRLRKGYY